MGNTRIMGNGVWGVGCAPRAHNRNTPKWEQIVPTETKPRTCMETLARYRRRRVAGVRSLPTKPGFRFSKPDPLDGAEFD